MKIDRISKLFDASPHMSVLLYGDSGTGKTSWAAKAPMPLFFLLEHQADRSIRLVREDANAIVIESMADLNKAWQAALTAEPVVLDDGQSAAIIRIAGHEITFQTLVIDSLTEYGEWLSNKAGVVPDKSTHRGQRLDANELFVARSRYLDIIKATKRFCADAGRIPANVIFIAKAHTDKPGAVVPLTTPYSIGKQVVGYFNACGFCRPSASGLGVQWKQTPGLICKPGASHWPAAIPNDATSLSRVSLGSLALYDGLVMDSDSRRIPANKTDSAEIVAEVISYIKRVGVTSTEELDEDGL